MPARFDTSRAVTRFDATVDIIEADLNAYPPPQKEQAPSLLSPIESLKKLFGN